MRIRGGARRRRSQRVCPADERASAATTVTAARWLLQRLARSCALTGCDPLAELRARSETDDGERSGVGEGRGEREHRAEPPRLAVSTERRAQR